MHLDKEIQPCQSSQRFQSQRNELQDDDDEEIECDFIKYHNLHFISLNFSNIEFNFFENEEGKIPQFNLWYEM